MIERSKTERFERTEENVDNRIQYVGQIAREGKLSNKKPKSRIIIRENKTPSDEKKEKGEKAEREGKLDPRSLFLDPKNEQESERRRTCSLHHVKSY